MVFFSLAALLPVHVMSILERPFYRMRFHMLYLICQVLFSLGCLPSLTKELVLNFQTLSPNPSTLPICRTGIKSLMTFNLLCTALPLFLETWPKSQKSPSCPFHRPATRRFPANSQHARLCFCSPTLVIQLTLPLSPPALDHVPERPAGVLPEAHARRRPPVLPQEPSRGLPEPGLWPWWDRPDQCYSCDEEV